MSKDPAFLFYSADFLVGTMMMTDEQVGKYIRLLCLQHQQGHLTKNHMVTLCKSIDEAIMSKFDVDEDGKYFNRRLDDEVDKRQKYVDSRRLNGSKGGRKPSKKGKHMETICKAYENHSEDENINGNDNDIDNRNEDKKRAFDEFWKAYPRKIGKQEALKVWKRLNPNQDLIYQILDAVDSQKHSEQWLKNNGQFIPHPTTWLNQGRWDDELPEKISDTRRILEL